MTAATTTKSGEYFQRLMNYDRRARKRKWTSRAIYQLINYPGESRKNTQKNPGPSEMESRRRCLCYLRHYIIRGETYEKKNASNHLTGFYINPLAGLSVIATSGFYRCARRGMNISQLWYDFWVFLFRNQVQTFHLIPANPSAMLQQYSSVTIQDPRARKKCSFNICRNVAKDLTITYHLNNAINHRRRSLLFQTSSTRIFTSLQSQKFIVPVVSWGPLPNEFINVVQSSAQELCFVFHLSFQKREKR